jgi:hypothetical protein
MRHRVGESHRFGGLTQMGLGITVCVTRGAPNYELKISNSVEVAAPVRKGLAHTACNKCIGMDSAEKKKLG